MNTKHSLIDIIRYGNTKKDKDDKELEFDMTGGRVIGEGGYGCVLKPAIKCNGKERKGEKYITKIQLSSDTSDKEIKIGKLVKKIPLSYKHFAPIVSNCESKPSVVSMITKNNNCKFLNEHPKKQFSISTIPSINGDDFKHHVYNQQGSSDMLYTIIHSYVYLLFSVYLLDKHGIIHYDLKGENIMYDINKKRPIIIDFGLSIPKKDIKPNFNDPDYMYNLTNHFYTYAPDYQLWCLDIHYLSFVCNYPNKNIKDKIEEMVDVYMSENKALSMLSTSFNERYRELSIRQLNSYADMGVEKSIEYIYTHCDTWDNYALSIMFLRLLKLIQSDEKTNHFLEFFEMLLCLNIHPIPKKRLSIKKTHDYMVSYLDKNINDISIFQQVINLIEKDKSNIKKAVQKQIKHDEAVSYKMSLFKP
jgi:serine/threonine protein kinase